LRKAFKYRLYPNRSQVEALEAMLETHRRLYNDALAERKDVYESEERSVSYGEQSGKLKEARESNQFLAATNFSSTQATLRRLDRAFKAFFRRAKSGEAPGYPRFKGRDRFDTVEFPSYGNGCRLKDNGRLYLQHVGHIKVKLHRPTVGTIKTVSVKRQCGKWYVVFVCDIGDAPEPIAEGPAVGIDLGLKSFLATDGGESVSPPQHYRKAQKRLRRASRTLSRRVKGSARRRKARQRVARLHEKVANQRRDFHHKTARKLVDSHGLIAHEALNVKGIARSRLAKSTHDAGWAQFVNILASKAAEAGVRVVAVDPRNTTQACSACGALPEVKKKLSDRTHSCPCGYVADRDVNAALNIKRLGLSLRDKTYRSTESVSREAVCFS
jgi:putative transposase